MPGMRGLSAVGDVMHLAAFPKFAPADFSVRR